MKCLKKLLLFFSVVWLVISFGVIAEKYMTGILVQWAVDDLNKLRYGIIILFGVFICNNILTAFGRRLFGHLVDRTIAKERQYFHKIFLKMPFSAAEQMSRGDVISRLTLNLERIQNFAENICPKLIQTFVEGILAFILCIYISPVLSLATFLSIPLIVILNIIAAIPLNPLIESRNQMENKGDKCALSFLENIKNIHWLNIQSLATKKYRLILDATYKQSQKICNYRSILTVFDAINFIMPYAITFGIGTLLAIQGDFYVGEMISFAYLMNSVTNLIGNIQGFLYDITEYKKSLQMVLDISENINKVKPAQGPIRTNDGCIRLDNVSFSYKSPNGCDQNVILHNVSMNIKPGEKVAITGSSGCGKSTLLKLILGLYDADCGEIFVPGTKDGKKLTISFLNQDMFLLPVSFRENIRGGMDNLDEKRIIKAAEYAEINAFIEQQPDGYDTFCHVEKLSGGERQRLCLARALAQDPDILLCDEPTAALDKKTASRIMENILCAYKNTTVIIVTHATEFLCYFDKIYELENGVLKQKFLGN